MTRIRLQGMALALLAAPAAAQQAELRDAVAPIRSIEFDSGDADLLPLAAAVGTARVVVLGEATHSDGAASRAKARVVRFLHERMGFDVLVWESGFLQSHAMNAVLRDSALSIEQAAVFLMSGGWAWDEDIQPLFEHARASWRGERPLIMAGMDTGRPHRAAPALMALLAAVHERAPSVLGSPADTVALRELAYRGFGFLSPELTTDSVRTAQLAALTRLEKRLQEAHDSLRVTFSERELRFLDRTLEHLRVSEWLKEARGMERALGRDREMARTLRWLIEEYYPDRKVIVWAATAHFTRNSDLITNPADSTMYRIAYVAGNHMGAWLGDDFRTIAFTSWGGSLGEAHPVGSAYTSQVRTIAPAGAGTIEDMLHEVGHEYAFVDLAAATAAGALPAYFASVALGRIHNVAPWARVVDGFFFIDQSRPVRYIR